MTQLLEHHAIAKNKLPMTGCASHNLIATKCNEQSKVTKTKINVLLWNCLHPKTGVYTCKQAGTWGQQRVSMQIAFQY